MIQTTQQNTKSLTNDLTTLQNMLNSIFENNKQTIIDSDIFEPGCIFFDLADIQAKILTLKNKLERTM